MDINTIKEALKDTPVSDIKYFESIGSTNDIAMDWALNGAKDYSLVLADQQTSGRGRLGRKWVTESGSSLAFSLIVHPTRKEIDGITLFSPLGALAISETLKQRYNIDTEIKWPNDVLYQRSKFCGILVETSWMENRIEGIVLGIGINITQASVPPADRLQFPATCVESAVGFPVDKLEVLSKLINRIVFWRERYQTTEFLEKWESVLAFKGEWVQIVQPQQEDIIGKLIGVDLNGNLRLKDRRTDKEISIIAGDLHLRPIDEK